MSNLTKSHQLVFAKGLRAQFIRRVYKDEYTLYRKHDAVIRRLCKDHDLLRFVIRAFEEYRNFMQQSVEVIRSSAELNQEALVDYWFEPAALVLNYLNAARIFVDHFKVIISRSFGPDSLELKNYQKILNSEFDEFCVFQ